MNILFVADVSIAKVVGGAERVLFEQSTRMAQRGHQVQILTRNLNIHQQSEEVVQGVREWRYRVDHKTPILFLANTFQNSTKLFHSICLRQNIDCINFHQPFSALGVIHSSRFRNIPKTYTCHSLSFEEFVSRNVKPKGLIKKIGYLLNTHMRRVLENIVLRNSDRIIVLSRYTRNRLRKAHKISPKKISVIPGGVNLNHFKPFSDKNEIRQKLDIPPNRVVLFTVRNLVQRMGLNRLIYAIENAVKAAPKIYLVVGGDGPLKDSLIALAKGLGVEKSVRFSGFIPEEELPDYYRMSDLFILPTRELEGFGLVTLEAMASGVPVIGTPIGGTKEILGKFDSSFLFADTSPESMAASILEKYKIISENPQEWSEISQRCRQYVENNYSWEKNVDSLEKIFYGGRAEGRCQGSGVRFQG